MSIDGVTIESLLLWIDGWRKSIDDIKLEPEHAIAEKVMGLVLNDLEDLIGMAISRANQPTFAHNMSGGTIGEDAQAEADEQKDKLDDFTNNLNEEEDVDQIKQVGGGDPFVPEG